MTKYYKEVDFGDTIEEKPVTVVEAEVDVKSQLKAVKDELGKILQGKSDFVPYGVHPNPRGAPHMDALLAFELKPSKERLDNFLSLVKAEINRRAAQEFAKLFEEIYPGVGKEL